MFSLRWFDKNWKAPNGLSYNELCALWTQMGGSELPFLPAQPAHPDRLLAGEGLFLDAALRSADGRFKVNMQSDGNLVLHGPGDQPIWATGTSGHPEVFDVLLQSDGNLVVHDGQNKPLWATGTNGNPAATLHLQNDGNLVLLSAANKPLWASNTVVPEEPATPTKASYLLPGQGLIAGGVLKSADGRFKLNMQTDGNLVLHGPADQPLWASGTNGNYNVWDVTMQGDGNLVVHDAQGQPLWATGTNGNPGSRMHLQNDGNLIVLSPAHQPLWASNTAAAPEPAAPAKNGQLLPGQGLMAGGVLRSADGRFKLNLQPDGNLVLHGPGDQPLWATGTNGNLSIWDVTMQNDGNLVVHNAQGQPLWATGTNGNPGATLHLQNDGNLVLVSATNQQLWTSSTAGRPEPEAPTKSGLLLSGQGLAVGTALRSSNGDYTFRLQSDANLLLVDKYAQPLWSSGTNGDMGVWDLTMQTDGNLVLHDLHGQPLWASHQRESRCNP